MAEQLTPEQERHVAYIEFRETWKHYLWTVLEWDYHTAKEFVDNYAHPLRPDGDYCRRRSPAQEKAIADLYGEE